MKVMKIIPIMALFVGLTWSSVGVANAQSSRPSKAPSKDLYASIEGQGLQQINQKDGKAYFFCDVSGLDKAGQTYFEHLIQRDANVIDIQATHDSRVKLIIVNFPALNQGKLLKLVDFAHKEVYTVMQSSPDYASDIENRIYQYNISKYKK